jgi:hypothetical protein
MTGTQCAHCGGGTSVFARACPHCGAPGGRVAGVMVAGALLLLLAAVMVAAVVVLRWHQLAVATETGAPADEQIAAGATADLGWLETAMSGCDDEAKADPETLHFLVTPLVPANGGTEPWRAKSISDAGNGIVLRSNDTLDGLKSGALRIYPADYAFSIFDPSDGELHRWQPSVGVTKFSTAEAGPIVTFKVQFRTSRSGAEADWGSSFNRLRGSCYWVNAILGR